MKYSIACSNLYAQFLEISIEFHCKENEKITLQFPAWRPGRYEIANFGQKLKTPKLNLEGATVPLYRTSKDQWSFEAEKEGVYQLSYLYHASQMDAGGCFVCPEFIYYNFSNFAFDVSGKTNDRIFLEINSPLGFEIATSLRKLADSSLYIAENYQELIDSPVLIAKKVTHIDYEIGGTHFNLWTHGNIHFDLEHLKNIFIDFTTIQLRGFGEFPAPNYHFILFLLPYPSYHGVEHAQSTVITIGPSESLSYKELFDELIGVSSHELYHAWNVCKIRPKELLPYDLSKEILLDTGLILEGVTTYMGDKILLQSNYFSLEDYLTIFKSLMIKEFHHTGWKNESIIESSYGLWIDGYKSVIPNKKVSIYSKGALICFCLDILLIQANSSLQELMRAMYRKFGKTQIPYTLNDFKELVILHAKNSEKVVHFFNNYVIGHEDLYPVIVENLQSIGINCELPNLEPNILNKIGIKIDSNHKITQIHPDSDAYRHLMLGDEITHFNDQPFDQFINSEHHQIEIRVIRWGLITRQSIFMTETSFFPDFQLSVISKNEFTKKWLSY